MPTRAASGLVCVSRELAVLVGGSCITSYVVKIKFETTASVGLLYEEPFTLNIHLYV